jgi:hypothetical protein
MYSGKYHTDRYVDRLVGQWLEHNTLIVAVDFDDTIFPGNVNNKIDLAPVVDLVKRCAKLGFKIVMYTARNDKEGLEEVETYCKEIQLDIQGVNVDVIQLYGNSTTAGGKIYYNILLDDKAGLEQSCEILKEAYAIIHSLIIRKISER